MYIYIYKKRGGGTILTKMKCEICALLGIYAAHSGNSLPTFQDNPLVPSQGSRIFLDSGPLKKGPTVCPETSVKKCHYMLCNFPEEHRSHLLCGTSLKLRKIEVCTIRIEALIILLINVY